MYMTVSHSLTSTSDYLPGPEALLIRIDLSEYLIEYYLHRKDVAPETLAEQDEKLKELIACFAIHLAARPPMEEHAWTVHLVAEHPFSLFVTGSTGPVDGSGHGDGLIVGNILTENIRHTDVNSLHAQYTVKVGTVFKSYVQSESAEISRMVEHFYEQSEQSPLRIKHSTQSDISIGLVALPDSDPTWIAAADLEELSANYLLPIKRMRSCNYEFRCDCSPDKLLPFFRSLTEEALTELYGADEALIISCPRCGKFFPISREQIKPKEN